MSGLIETSVVDGTTFFKATRNGVEYWAYENWRGWNVTSQRLALGRRNPGTFRLFATVADVSASVKAFAGLDALLSETAVAA